MNAMLRGRPGAEGSPLSRAQQRKQAIATPGLPRPFRHLQAGRAVPSGCHSPRQARCAPPAAARPSPRLSSAPCRLPCSRAFLEARYNKDFKAPGRCSPPVLPAARHHCGPGAPASPGAVAGNAGGVGMLARHAGQPCTHRCRPGAGPPRCRRRRLHGPRPPANCCCWRSCAANPWNASAQPLSASRPTPPLPQGRGWPSAATLQRSGGRPRQAQHMARVYSKAYRSDEPAMTSLARVYAGEAGCAGRGWLCAVPAAARPAAAAQHGGRPPPRLLLAAGDAL